MEIGKDAGNTEGTEVSGTSNAETSTGDAGKSRISNGFVQIAESELADLRACFAKHGK